MTTTRKAPPSLDGRNGAPPSAGGRGADGKFVPGNSCGRGNPYTRAVAARRRALLDAVGEEDVRQVAHKLLEQSLSGDVAAAKVLLAFVCGRPAPAADPDDCDADELRRLLASPDLAGMTGVTRVAPPVALFELTRQLVKTPERLLEVMQARLVEMLREWRGKVGPAEYFELEQLAESAGLGDAMEGDDNDE
jgi:hypothetical protein